MEWVEITHPDLDAPPARVTRKAFEDVHRKKGFLLTEERWALDMSNTRAQLKEAAESVGLAVTSSMTKAEILTALTEGD